VPEDCPLSGDGQSNEAVRELAQDRDPGIRKRSEKGDGPARDSQGDLPLRSVRDDLPPSALSAGPEHETKARSPSISAAGDVPLYIASADGPGRLGLENAAVRQRAPRRPVG
jgi:hypothetical protein